MKTLHMDTRPDWRGGQFQVLLTLRGQRARGHDAQLMARRDSPLAQRAFREGFPVHYIPSRLLRVRSALRLREILAQQAFDIVHAHDPHALTSAWLAGAHRRAGLVASRRVALPLSRDRLSLTRYRAAHRIIAISKFVALTLADSGINPSRVAVVHDGVEIPPETTQDEWRAARSRWKIADDETLIGCVGYLVQGKRQDVAIRALARVRRDFSKCKLLLAGDGPDRPGLESLARELGVASAVIFAGFVEEIDSVYQALDFFVFPAVGEALGTSLLLAMAHGLPCVAAASGGVPEIIESWKNGILVGTPAGLTLRDAIGIEIVGASPGAAQAAKTQRAAEFADAIHELLADPSLAARLGKAARQTIIDHFSADALVESTLEKYRKVLSHK
ncbi:MAG TPA: glycosyltransferase family 4 protein [Candidatus Acidoferrales bacterium]|nr:glycosyltransferase family 4 protein [Candidatus Acidoferrales bacterium]